MDTFEREKIGYSKAVSLNTIYKMFQDRIVYDKEAITTYLRQDDLTAD